MSHTESARPQPCCGRLLFTHATAFSFVTSGYDPSSPKLVRQPGGVVLIRQIVHDSPRQGQRLQTAQAQLICNDKRRQELQTHMETSRNKLAPRPSTGRSAIYNLYRHINSIMCHVHSSVHKPHGDRRICSQNPRRHSACKERGVRTAARSQE